MLLLILVIADAGCNGNAAPRQSDVEAALRAASAALVVHDADAWKAALPTEGQAAERAWGQAYTGLARYKWAGVFADVVPVDPRRGRYGIRFHGQLAGSGAAPIVGERLLEFAWRQGRLTLVADRTVEARERLQAAPRPLAGAHPAQRDDDVHRTRELTGAAGRLADLAARLALMAGHDDPTSERERAGGPQGARTPDLRRARAALSQLS